VSADLPAKRGVANARLRLTLVYAGTLVLLLLVFSAVVYALLTTVVSQDIEPFRDDPGIVAAAHRMLVKDAALLALANVGALVLVGAIAVVLAKAALRPLEKAIELQQQFTNDASHDLRTPLAVIRTETSAALHEGAVPQAAALQRMQIIDDQAQRMERLIDQLLTLSHVDADSALNREPTDLLVVANGVVRDLRPLAAARKIDIELARGESAVVMGDELKLSQLVANLLDNALKYSPERTPVRLSVWQNRDSAYLAVADQGPGIPPGLRDDIFMRFHRLKPLNGKGRAGHGLGLPLCRWIARAHGGDVSVDGGEPCGSTFTVRLPALVS